MGERMRKKRGWKLHIEVTGHVLVQGVSSVFPRPLAAAPSGNLLGMQILRLPPKTPTSKPPGARLSPLCFKAPQMILMRPKCEKFALEQVLLTPRGWGLNFEEHHSST